MGTFQKRAWESVEILPASQRFSEDWYQGTADAVYQNIDIIRDELPKYVMILSGDHIYRMDYGTMLAQHVQSGAKMTVSCMKVPIPEAAGAFGVMSVDENKRVLAFTEKPEQPDALPDDPENCLASMGNYIFDTEFLFNVLEDDKADNDSEHDFGKNIIPRIIEDHQVQAFVFGEGNGNENYWRDVGTIDSFLAGKHGTCRTGSRPKFI